MGKQGKSNKSNKSKKELTDEFQMRQAETKAADQEVTDIGTWKSAGPQGTKLMLPSGNVCLCTNPGLQVFLEEGMIPNSLMAIVLESVNEGKGAPPSKLKEVENDPDMLRDAIALANAVTLRCVLAPPIAPVPAEGEPRDPDRLYVDELDLNDKMFVFQWVVGGTRDLERFREETSALVEDLSDGEGDEQEAI